jgi:phage tail tape-measure protein
MEEQRKQTASGFLSNYVELLKQREDQLGAILKDGASSLELAALSDHFKQVLDAENTHGTPTEIWQLYKHIAETMDKWLFPESDPIAERVVPFLNAMRESLGTTMDGCIPNSIEMRRKWEDTRAVVHWASRADVLEKANKSQPGFLMKALRMFQRK